MLLFLDYNVPLELLNDSFSQEGHSEQRVFHIAVQFFVIWRSVCVDTSALNNALKL
jgi:hypothetical protein